jgi:hypothetical protein
LKKVYSMVLCLLSTLVLQGAITLKTDFLRSSKTYKNVQFPLEIDGYLDLSLRVIVNDISEPEGLTACHKIEIL